MAMFAVAMGVSVVVTMVMIVVVAVFVIVIMPVAVLVLMSVFMPMTVVAGRVVVRVQLEQRDTHDGVRTGFEAQDMFAGVEMVGAGPFKGQGLVEEAGFERQLMVEVEGVDVDDLFDAQVALGGAVDLGDAVDPADPVFEMVELVRGDEVDLVEQDAVGEGDLFLGFGGVIDVQGDVLGVDDGHDAVEPETGLEILIGEEGLGDRSGISEAGGFDEDVVEAVPALEELAEDADEVAADGAAEAPVVHLEDFLVGIDDQGVVDADLAELIFDHGDAFSVVRREDSVEEGGLAGAEKAGEDRDGNASVCRSSHALWGDA